MNGDQLPPSDPSPDNPTVAAPITPTAPNERPASDLRATPDVLSGPFPTRFGRYSLLKLLGKGGMGAVYLARDLQLNRLVALKVPHFHGPESYHLRDRFLREARVAATLAHPNLCPVYDCGSVNGIMYLTMAYLEGKALAQFIRPEQHLPPRAVAAVVRQLALAMQEAHSKGVIHRDLKPNNIMITPSRQPVIMDFGLARRTDEADLNLTQSGLLLGTPAYMPPEQLNSDAKAMGPATDVYALGVILYELLTGRPPFQGALGSLMSQIMTAPPPPLARWRAHLDPALDTICARALAKKPADRFQTMREFAGALEDYLRGKPAAPTPPPDSAVTTVADDGPLDENDAARLFRVMAARQRTPRPAFRKKHQRRVPEWFIPLSVGTSAMLFVGVGLWLFFHHLEEGSRARDPLGGWTLNDRQLAEEQRRQTEVQTLNSALARWRADPDDIRVRRELDDWLHSTAARTDLPPETNLGLGQYAILENNRWPDGLRRLTLSNLGVWRDVADLDLNAQVSHDPPVWVECGHGWWSLADGPDEPVVDRFRGLTDQHRQRLRERAAYWYKQAVDYVDDTTATLIRERLQILEANN